MGSRKISAVKKFLCKVIGHNWYVEDRNGISFICCHNCPFETMV